jgi:hypothetical protein
MIKKAVIGHSVRILLAAGVVLLLVGAALAYETWTDTGIDNCAACHGDFRNSPYISLSDGQSWNDDLHDVHRNDMLSRECDVCHGQSNSPVILNSSNGGVGLPAISCQGCHGRDDGTGTIVGTGLRQRHFRTGAATCDGAGCHADSDPANATPVGEDVLPPYYNQTTFYPDIPTDPCNPSAGGFPENYAGSTLGMDNDGDLNYDEADTDCGAVSVTPGETAQLLVTAHDPGVSTMTLQYGIACVATEHTLVWGPIDQVSTYAYSGQNCLIGNTGTYDWNYPTGSLFFLIAGQDTTNVGSYGLDSAGVERPIDPTCGQTQDLTSRCD